MNQSSKTHRVLRWALTLMIAMLVWAAFERSMGWHGPKIGKHMLYTQLFYVVMMVLYYFAIREHKTHLGSRMTWREGFTFGVIITIFAAILAPVAQYITLTYLSPQYIEEAVASGIARGMTQEVATRYYSMKLNLLMAPLQTIFWGVLISAAVAVGLKGS